MGRARLQPAPHRHHNLSGAPQARSDDVCCQRGAAQNRIKEAQVGLFAPRTSCHVPISNRLRRLLAALGCVLIERLRARTLQGTALAVAQLDTLRIKLLPGLELAQRANLRARHEPVDLTLNGKQRPAGAMTQRWPATQAGVGAGATAWRLQAISTLAATPIATSFAHIRSAMPLCGDRWLYA